MASKTDSSLAFFSKAKSHQWSYVLSLYKEVLKLKAVESRCNKKNGPQELIKIDDWYQETLPSKLNTRKERHILHDELVQVTKWKMMRGKYRPRLLDLVRTNTETAVVQTTKKAFKKLPNLNGALNALTTLKGISPATASAVLAAGAPEICPYMADESMLATPGIEAADYTISEYLNYAEQIKGCSERLKIEDPNAKWNPHKVELVLWTHYLARQLNPSLLDDLPSVDGSEPQLGNLEDDCPQVPLPEVVTANGTTGANHISSEDSNNSMPNSELDEKSCDSLIHENSKNKVEGNGDTFRHPAGNGKIGMEDTDSKEGVEYSSEENSRGGNDENSKNDLISSNENSKNEFINNEGEVCKQTHPIGIEVPIVVPDSPIYPNDLIPDPNPNEASTEISDIEPQQKKLRVE